MGQQSLPVVSEQKRLEMEELALRRSSLDLMGYPGNNDIFGKTSNDDQTDWFVIMVMGCGILMICCGFMTIGEWCRRNKSKILGWCRRNRQIAQPGPNEQAPEMPDN